ncbi:MAG: caspase family protein [Rhodobacteraceae bacterium]|nr:caspase family protein [Paracoccaceae bacterium]
MRAFLLAALAFLLVVPGGASASNRHALVVGIDTYQNVSVLQKARNDARAVGAALEASGFRTDVIIDPGRRDLTRALGQFVSRLAQGDEAVFYFAGHGVEIDGRNFLLPADVPLASPGEEFVLTSESLAVDDVLAAIRGQGARVSLLILDACRNNPFPREGTRSLGGSRGLARVAAPEGTFILFSAGVGQTALDRLSDNDPDPNSVFTRALLPLLEQPGLSVRDLAVEVRGEVRSLARTVGHDQFPAYYDQLDGAFAFRPGQIAALTQPSVAAPTPVPGPAAAQDICAEARAVWTLIEESRSTPALERFMERYAACPVLVALAQDRLASLAPPAPAPVPEVAAVLGMRLVALSSGGLEVREVLPGSAAALRDIRPGDVVAEVNARPVTTPEAFRALLQGAADDGRLTALVLTRRGPVPRFVALELADLASDPCTGAAAAWELIRHSPSPGDLRGFLERYGACVPEGPIARVRLGAIGGR